MKYLLATHLQVSRHKLLEKIWRSSKLLAPTLKLRLTIVRRIVEPSIGAEATRHLAQLLLVIVPQLPKVVSVDHYAAARILVRAKSKWKTTSRRGKRVDSWKSLR